ncbi:LysR family transcriptional regulator [Lactobacillus sp. ESL0703]|uniref:LysR family transcriptional regulator n=1 Tax=Lactobacillus sp. ESL0703 TaxID=2983218 RepID=UPI0023F63401|nr:LysR family transcriptional regulator [Lactobacillus sp. ESL0703]MDF7668991.1 LysR family transcriptional regulator [Lactobacillus sp. ESL0703]
MNYNLMPVKYFVDVVQTHGFISAAKRNYVSETAVSSAIKKLENELGHKLLNRTAGEFSLTPTGELFYERAVEIINSYSEIWHNPDEHPEKLLRIHFLQGLESHAARLANCLPDKYVVSFDEEAFNTSISRLLKNNYDILIGFQLEFAGNSKVITFPLETVDFDLVFNSKSVKKYNQNLKNLAKNSTIYMQDWKSTGILNIQTAMLEAYAQEGWSYKEIAAVNDFSAAYLNVNYRGGLTMLPSTFQSINYCENIYRISPEYLKNKFEIVVAISASKQKELTHLITKAITLSYQQ